MKEKNNYVNKENMELAKDAIKNAAIILYDAGIERKSKGIDKEQRTVTEYHGLGFYLYIGCAKQYINDKKPDLIQIEFEHNIVYDGFGNVYNPGPWEDLLKVMKKKSDEGDILAIKQKEYLDNCNRAMLINEQIDNFMKGQSNFQSRSKVINDDIKVIRNYSVEERYMVVYKDEYVYTSNKYNEIELLIDGPWEDFIVNYKKKQIEAKEKEQQTKQQAAVDKYMLELK